MERRLGDLEAEMDSVKRTQASHQVQLVKLAQLAVHHGRRLDEHAAENREFRRFMDTLVGQLGLIKWLIAVVPGLAVVLATLLVWTIAHVK